MTGQGLGWFAVRLFRAWTQNSEFGILAQGHNRRVAKGASGDMETENNLRIRRRTPAIAFSGPIRAPRYSSIK